MKRILAGAVVLTLKVIVTVIGIIDRGEYVDE